MAEFNDTYLNKCYNGSTQNMSANEIDEYVDSSINFSRKNYCCKMERDGSIKKVGNTVKSRKMSGYLQKFLDKAQKEFGDTVKYLLIIEGQASNDGYSRNYELSYDRALSFFNYLKQNRNVDLRRDNCEVLICGSGTHGAMRAEPDNATNKNNQRFLIHVLPKPGIIE